MTRRVDGHLVTYRDNNAAVIIGGRDGSFVGFLNTDDLGLFMDAAISWEESSKRLGVVMEAMALAYLRGQEDATQGKFA